MKIIFNILIALGVCSSAHSMNLSDFLDQVSARHRGIKSAIVGKEMAADRQQSGDIALVPTLTLKGSYLSDKKQPNFYGASETKMTQYSLGLGKRFSTGTSVQLNAVTTGNENADIAAVSMQTYAKYGQGSLGVSFSQSLWKDAFGSGIRLRRERESYAFQAEKGAYDLQERQILAEAETIYWDYLFSLEELRVRKASLERAQKIESWIRRRVSDGISDRADLYNAQALVASRRLQLITSQDDHFAVQKRMRDALELGTNDPLPEIKSEFEVNRPLSTFFEGKGRVVRLDSYLAFLEAKTKKLVAEEVEDAYSADLVLSGSYNTNTYKSGGGISDVNGSLGDRDTPTSSVSLSWTYLFDTDVKKSAKMMARKDAQAAQLRSDRKFLESDSAWSEMLRRYEELTKKVEATSLISRLQMDRARAEQDKLSKGRSITSNVITSEQEAAEAELMHIRMKAEQRKMEAQTRMYVQISE